ncbi:MAG: hypothetical protein WC043_09640 [Pseudobdellovibrionaceae bacterium]
MLHHDLYILSLYFTPEHAVMYEDEVMRRYNQMDIAALVERGLIRIWAPQWFFRDGRPYFLPPDPARADGRRARSRLGRSYNNQEYLN